jgi:uncharacterized membrane protein YoaK (UPF0700 family)
MKISLSEVLSVNAGCVDTTGFLALSGLFTSHVTGNFVTLGASLVFGTSGTVAKVLALPVFCLTVFVVKLLGQRLQSGRRGALRTLLTWQLVLLTVAAVLAVGLGPFASADRLPAIVTGLTMVAAMATQNAAHRLHLPNTPPSTVMTMTTTQIMLDVGEIVHGSAPDAQAAVRGRLRRLTLNVVMFAAGCSAAALAYARLGIWCFLLPPVLGLLATLLPAEPAAAPAR